MLRLRASGAALAALSLLASAVPANAQERLVTVQKRVSFRDLNLASDRDVETLRRRIVSAVNELCAPDALSPKAVDNQCVAKAKAGAMLQMDEAVRNSRLAHVASLSD